MLQSVMEDEDIRRTIRQAMHNRFTVAVEEQCEGEFHMRRDEEHAQRLIAGETEEIQIRLYSWAPWCVSLGANQSENDIDTKRIHERGYGIVRRATGGRAVFHAEELTYSLVMRLPDEIQSYHIYRWSHEWLRAALEDCGAKEIVFQKSQPDFAKRYRTEGDSISCFTSAARSEIMWHDRKVVGSAQRLYGRVLLQHGSILLGPAHEELADLVCLDSAEKRESLRRSIQQQSVSMQEICSRTVSVRECLLAVMRQLQTF